MVKNPPASAGHARHMGLIPASRSPGVENGNPLQYSRLENSMDRGAWQATVHGAAKSWTWLSNCAHMDTSLFKSKDLPDTNLNCPCTHAQLPQYVQLSATLWTMARQSPLSMGFSRQKSCSGLLFFPPGGSSWPRDQTCVPYDSCIGGRFFTTRATWKVSKLHLFQKKYFRLKVGLRKYNKIY